MVNLQKNRFTGIDSEITDLGNKKTSLNQRSLV